MKRKNILYLSPSNRMLGAQISLLTLLKYLDRDKYNPIVITPDNTDGLLDELRKIDVKTYRMRLWNWRKGKFWLKIPGTMFRVHQLIRQENVDLVHSNEFWCNPYGVIAGKLFNRIPLVTHIRLDITPKKIKHYYLSKSDRILCVSRATSELFRESGFMEKVETIYNGLDLTKFDDYEARRVSFRNEFGYTDEHLVIGEIAQLDERKNQLKVLELVPDLVRQYPHIRFFFAGEARYPEYRRLLEQFIHDHHLEEYCILAGFRKDIPAVCAGLDISVLPSDREGFGRALIETMYMRVPAIGSDAGGIPEVIDHANCGFVFPLSDFSLLRHYLVRMIEEKELRLSMSERSRERVIRLFSAKAYVDNVCRVYEELLEENV